MTPRVSIIVPSKKGDVVALERQLMRQSLHGWELIVRSGIAPPARARNLGAWQARGETLVFLDDDIQLGDANLLDDLVTALSRTAAGSAVGVRWRTPPSASLFQRWQVAESFGDRAAAASAEARETPWDSLSTSCLSMRKRAFEALGGFDERLVSGEDAELGYRLTRAGGRFYALAGRWIYHEPPRTFWAAARKTVWYERGNAQVARKHPASGYRMTLHSPWHAAGYLVLRTVLLAPLMFVQISYRHRRPRLAFRPLAALLSYIGAWAYCFGWFAEGTA